MLKLLFSLLGLITIAPLAIPIAFAIFGVSLLCLSVTVVAISITYGWSIFKACVWFFVNIAINSIPFLLERERKVAHESLNVLLGYSIDCHDPERAPVTPDPSTPLKPHLMDSMTSHQWLSRNASIASIATNTAMDFENADTWIHDDDDSEALYMARRRSILQPSFDAPTFDTVSRSRRNSRASSPEASRPHSRAPVPSNYTGFADSMRPPSRNGSDFFNSNPVTPLRGHSTSSSADTQYFQIQPTTPISLHGRRPSWSPTVYRKNNQSTTSFGSVPEEVVGLRADGSNDETKS